MSDAKYEPLYAGRELPPEMGSTGDDRMDLANVVGADLVEDITTALAIAERVLFSKWYREVRDKAGGEGYDTAVGAILSSDWQRQHDREVRAHERERVRIAVGAVLANASNFPEKVAPRILGQNMGPLIEKVTDAVLNTYPEEDA